MPAEPQPQSAARARRRSRRLLRAYLGVWQVIWLGDGVVDDETDGHIDNLACFARPGEVCLTWIDDRRDPQYRGLAAMRYERLMAARDARGRRLKVHKLPSPGPLYMTRREAAGIVARPGIRTLRAGQRLAGSYVNFYIANDGVVMPLLDARTDAAALRSAPARVPRPARASACRRARSCWAAATSTASRSRFRRRDVDGGQWRTLQSEQAKRERRQCGADRQIFRSCCACGQASAFGCATPMPAGALAGARRRRHRNWFG